jgi:hypothetical protein
MENKELEKYLQTNKITLDVTDNKLIIKIPNKQNEVITYQDTKEESLIIESYSKRIINAKDYLDKPLIEILNDKEQLKFIEELSAYEFNCIAEEDWLNFKDNHRKLQQEEYKKLVTPLEKKIFAKGMAIQFAQERLNSKLKDLLDFYNLDCFNTFLPESTKFEYK